MAEGSVVAALGVTLIVWFVVGSMWVASVWREGYPYYDRTLTHIGRRARKRRHRRRR